MRDLRGGGFEGKGVGEGATVLSIGDEFLKVVRKRTKNTFF